MTTDELLQRWSDGSITADELRELTAKLAEPEHQNALLDNWLLETSLPDRLPGASVAGLHESPMNHRAERSASAREKHWTGWLQWRPLAVAAAFAICATWLGVEWQRGSAAKVSTQDVAWLATVLLAEDCEWTQPRALHEGERLSAETLRLNQGMAVLRFDGGAEVVLRGGTDLELQSAVQARLLRGAVTVRAANEAAGFKLITPASEMTDLGTEFAVKVERSGATELHVIEGEVAYAPDATTDVAVLNAGKALRFDSASDAPHPVALDALRFAELVKQANPRERPDLMTVYEGFHYEAGTYPPAQISNGKGWAGPWRLREGTERQSPAAPDATTDMRIIHGKLDVPWPVKGGQLGMLEMPPGKFYRVRQMAAPLAMNHDGITYFSLMTQEPDHSTLTSRKRTNEGVRLTFRSTADYWGESLSFGLGDKLRPVVRTDPGGIFESLGSVPDEQSLLWIGKIIRRADGADEIMFRIYGQDDPLDYAEPAAWHVSTRSVRHKAALDLVVISSSGASPRIIDELRIGPTWRSVVPIRKKGIAVAP